MKNYKDKVYIVSMALRVYANFETEVSAKNKKDAIHKAVIKYENGEYDDSNITDPDWINAKLDMGSKMQGVNVERNHDQTSACNYFT